MLFQANFMDFRDIIAYMQNIGVYDVFLPFLLIFAIMFAILEKTEVLGKKHTNINAVVALIIGLLLVVQKGIVDTINTFLPRVSLIIVVLLMFLLLLSLLAGKEFQGLSKALFGIGIVVIIIALYFALSPSDFLSQSDRDTLLSVGLPIAALLLLIWFITKGESTGPKPEERALKFFETLGEGFNRSDKGGGAGGGTG
jgi:hypothetical protein